MFARCSQQRRCTDNMTLLVMGKSDIYTSKDLAMLNPLRTGKIDMYIFSNENKTRHLDCKCIAMTILS